MSETTRKYSEEFKGDAVKLVLEAGYSLGAAAKNLGIPKRTLRDWVKKDQGTESRGAEERTKEEELKRLKAENVRLKLEREILKKAAAFFATESL